MLEFGELEGPSPEKQRVVQIARVSLHEGQPLELTLSSPPQDDNFWTQSLFGLHQHLSGARLQNTTKPCKQNRQVYRIRCKTIAL